MPPFTLSCLGSGSWQGTGPAWSGAELTDGARLLRPHSAPTLWSSASRSRKWAGAPRPHMLGGLSELVHAKHLVGVELDMGGNINDLFSSPVLLLSPAVADKFNL